MKMVLRTQGQDEDFEEKSKGQEEVEDGMTRVIRPRLDLSGLLASDLARATDVVVVVGEEGEQVTTSRGLLCLLSPLLASLLGPLDTCSTPHLLLPSCPFPATLAALIQLVTTGTTEVVTRQGAAQVHRLNYFFYFSYSYSYSGKRPRQGVGSALRESVGACGGGRLRAGGRG